MNKINLICFPFAGAGASIFHEWQGVSDKINIIAVQLPGREKRFVEPAYSQVDIAVSGLLPEIMEGLDKSTPVVLFGHSLGAILAFEFAWRLLRKKEIHLLTLIVSGSPSPWHKRKENASGLPDEEFIKRIKEFAGYSHPALEDPMMREILLPTLRADVKMHENYRPSGEKVLDVPILTLRGSSDELVSAEDKQLWSRASSKQTLHKELPGGHMYLIDHGKEVIALIEKTIF